jgi:hypothetical protein
LGPFTQVQALLAPTATTGITRTLVRLTVSTALTTSWAASSSVLVLGSMDSTAVAASTAMADTMDAADMLGAALTDGLASLAVGPALPDAVASTHAVA